MDKEKIKPQKMITKVTYKEEPTLFEDIREMSVHEIREHRKGSTFYAWDVIEIKLEHAELYPEIKDFEKYVGYWKTNQTIYNDNDGFEDEYSELTRVEKKEVVSYEWAEIAQNK